LRRQVGGELEQFGGVGFPGVQAGEIMMLWVSGL